MFDRNIDEIYGDYASVYRSVVDEAEESFENIGKTLTIFQKILIDKVADAYVATVRVGDSAEIADPKKVRAQAAELQKWLTMALHEEREAEKAVQAKVVFYEKIVNVLEELIVDDVTRRAVLRGLREITEE